MHVSIQSQLTFLFLQYYKSQIHPILGNPASVDEKFKQIVEQRESRAHNVEVKILLEDGTTKWVNIDSFLMNSKTK